MFDKIYRQATDDVPLNTGLLADLKKQAKQLDEQKPAGSVKKPVFNIYRYGFVAAALVVAVLGTNIFSSYMATKNSVAEEAENYIENSAGDSADNGKQELIPGETQTAESADKAETAGTAEDVAEPEKSVAVSDADKQNAINYTEKSEKATDLSESAGEAAKVGDIPTKNEKVTVKNDETEPATEDVLPDETGSTETVVFAVQADKADSGVTAEVYSDETEAIAEETDEPAAYTKAASGGGGGGGASAARGAGADATVRETWGIDDYCSYFGVDISGIKLPGVMKSSRSGSAYVEKNADGTVAGGQCSVYYVAGGKSVSLTLYSDSSYVKTVAVGEKLSSGASIVKYENGAFTLYAYPGGRGCIAEIFGFSEEEMTAFANSVN